MDNRELYHWGVKGMKWGVRRYQNKNGTLTSAGKKRRSRQDSEDVKSMSDQELRAKINRLQMESQYANLTKKQVSKGRKFVNGILIGAATGVLTSYANKYMDKGLKWAGGQAVNVAKHVIKR